MLTFRPRLNPASNLSGERRLDRPFRRRLQSRPKCQH